MGPATSDPMARGEAHLKAGEWSAAIDAYGAALADAESGEALFGLGIASWWLGRAEESLRTWERAYAAFRRNSEPAPAVLTAVYLSLAFRMTFGNDAAADGWLERGASLVDEFDLAPLEGWVLLARAYAANDSGRPARAERHARAALDTARRFGDTDLALCATSELGAALAAQGDVEQGGPLLDQAMAAALAGEAGDLDSVVLVSCRTITACARAADVRRAAQWIRAADDFQRRYGSTHLFTTCRTHHGAILFAIGAWPEAEAELEAALRIAGSVERVLRAEAAGKLAELRVAQGRIDEAAELLSGLLDQPVTAYARARLSIADGKPSAAASTARRRLRDIDGRGIEQAMLLDVLVEAEVLQGRPCRDLVDVTATSSLPGAVARAYACRAAGRAAAANERGATVDLEDALAAFADAEMTYECGRTRALIAATVVAHDRDTAIGEAKEALALFESLGAVRDADAAAAFLRTLGVRAARRGQQGIGLLTSRELDVLALLAEGLSNPAMADRLYVSRRTVEHHVASVLRKLGLTGRAEAAAYALRHLEPAPAPK